MPEYKVYPVTGKRLGLRLLACSTSAITLGVVSDGGTGWHQLAHVALTGFAGMGAVYVAMFPVQGDPQRHRGLLRFTREEMLKLPLPAPSIPTIEKHIALGGCDTGNHMLVTTYRRPLRRVFRKQSALRCWECDLRIDA